MCVKKSLRPDSVWQSENLYPESLNKLQVRIYSSRALQDIGSDRNFRNGPKKDPGTRVAFSRDRTNVIQVLVLWKQTRKPRESGGSSAG